MSLFCFHQNSSHYFYHLQFLSFMINETFISIFFFHGCLTVLFSPTLTHTHFLCLYLTHYLLFCWHIQTSLQSLQYSYKCVHTMTRHRKNEAAKDKILIKSMTMSTQRIYGMILFHLIFHFNFFLFLFFLEFPILDGFIFLKKEVFCSWIRMTFLCTF